jgi:ABC-type transport system substrate-binding protein
MNIAGADEVASGAATQIAGVKSLGPLAVQIQLKQPQAAFPAMLALSAFSIVPRQETLIAGDDFGTRVVIGTGPFKLVEWKKGDHLRLERNVGYFQAGQSQAAAIEISFNVAAPVALERLNAGEADFALLNENAEDWSAIRSDAAPKWNLRSGSSLAGSRIQFNPANRYTSDLRIRQAIVSAINPTEVFAAAQAEPAKGLLPPAAPQFDANFRNANAFDIDRARKLLAAAGYSNGIDDLVIFSNEQPAEVQAIRDQLAAAGMRTQLVTGDPAQVEERIRAGEIAIAYTTTRMDYNDAYAAFSTFTKCSDSADSGAPFQWCNKEVQTLLDEAEHLPMNSPERTALYQKMQSIVVNQDVNQFVVGWRKSVGLARAGNDVTLHLIYGMPDVATLRGVQP